MLSGVVKLQAYLLSWTVWLNFYCPDIYSNSFGICDFRGFIAPILVSTTWANNVTPRLWASKKQYKN